MGMGLGGLDWAGRWHRDLTCYCQSTLRVWGGGEVECVNCLIWISRKMSGVDAKVADEAPQL